MANVLSEILAELKDTAEKQANEFNELSASSKFAEANKMKADLIETVNNYTSEARTAAFNECKDSDDPMKKACLMIFYDTIRLKETPIENSILKEASIADTVKQINLKKLDKHCGGIGKDEHWYSGIQQFNQFMTVRQAIRYNIDPTEVFNSFYMKRITKDLELRGIDPATRKLRYNTKKFKENFSDNVAREHLNRIIGMMIGEEYKVRDEDFNAFVDTYAKLDKKSKLRVVCSNHDQLMGNIQQMCYAAITGESYELGFKKVKD